MYLRLIIISFFILCASDARALYYSGGGAQGYSVLVGGTGDIVNIASTSDQAFTVGAAATAISMMLIEQEYGVVGIGVSTDIRVKIPSGLEMLWQESDTTATIGGSASAKVSSTVSYEDSDKTLVINVTTDFSDGDIISVSGLSFDTFNAVVGAKMLELEIDNAETTVASDSGIKEINLPASSVVFTGGIAQGYHVVENTNCWVGIVNGIENLDKILGVLRINIKCVNGVCI